jgi:hypothetical protein
VEILCNKSSRTQPWTDWSGPVGGLVPRGGDGPAVPCRPARVRMNRPCTPRQLGSRPGQAGHPPTCAARPAGAGRLDPFRPGEGKGRKRLGEGMGCPSSSRSMPCRDGDARARAPFVRDRRVVAVSFKARAACVSVWFR